LVIELLGDAVLAALGGGQGGGEAVDFGVELHHNVDVRGVGALEGVTLLLCLLSAGRRSLHLRVRVVVLHRGLARVGVELLVLRERHSVAVRDGRRRHRGAGGADIVGAMVPASTRAASSADAGRL
jgi:hypothetical protein